MGYFTCSEQQTMQFVQVVSEQSSCTCDLRMKKQQPWGQDYINI